MWTSGNKWKFLHYFQWHLGECTSGYLSCDNGKCIPQKLICDFKQDCEVCGNKVFLVFGFLVMNLIVDDLDAQAKNGLGAPVNENNEWNKKVRDGIVSMDTTRSLCSGIKKTFV